MEEEEILGRVDPGLLRYRDIILELYGAPFARANGIEIESITKEHVRLSMEMRPDHLNSNGVGHGGAVFALVDHAFGFAGNVCGCRSVGYSCNIVYHRPAVSDRLVCESSIINESRSFNVFDIRVYGDGKLVASCVCTGFKSGEGVME
ncbi:MAG: PaaI family thioesterase [Candidatus Methanomethylophilaceae archaeon]|jgi:acyl-CoA thioesterase|nr:PaaI family thioesterase [Candidatus Methanomethylophilaceae archaeon]NLF33868.1 PaaI family thioesterase [Thermoplasmatales archaeon]